MADSKAELEVLTKVRRTHDDGPFHTANDPPHETLEVAIRTYLALVVRDEGTANLLQNGTTTLDRRDESLVGKPRLPPIEANRSMAPLDPDRRVGEIKVGDCIRMERVVSR